MQQTVTISRKSRNLGVGWTTGQYEYPTHPTSEGDIWQCYRELGRISRVCGDSTEYHAALFVAGRRVIAIINDDGEPVSVVDPIGSYSIWSILDDLKSGQHVSAYLLV